MVHTSIGSQTASRRGATLTTNSGRISLIDDGYYRGIEFYQIIIPVRGKIMGAYYSGRISRGKKNRYLQMLDAVDPELNNLVTTIFNEAHETKARKNAKARKKESA